MIESIRNSNKYFKDGLSVKLSFPKNYRRVNNIIVIGMGASIIPGQVLKETLPLKIPFEISNNYKLPSFANRKTLVICISRSGNTKETLIQLKEAVKRNCKIVMMSCGGQIEKEAKKLNKPYVRLPLEFNEKETRETFTYLLSCCLKILKDLKIYREPVLVKALEKDRRLIERKAKNLSKKIKNKFPIICSPFPSVSFRWEGQLSENSKIISKGLTFPELAHNELVGWEKLNKDHFLIFLRETKERKEIKILVESLKKLIKNKVQLVEVYGKGKTELERALYLIWFGDFLSYFLAKEYKIDAKKTDYIAKMKEEIRKRGKKS